MGAIKRIRHSAGLDNTQWTFVIQFFKETFIFAVALTGSQHRANGLYLSIRYLTVLVKAIIENLQNPSEVGKNLPKTSQKM